MRHFRVIGAMIFAFVFITCSAVGQEESPTELAGCGGRTVTIADLQWPSASILAHIHGALLENEFACETQIVTSDLANVAATLSAAQEPRLVPEFWISRVAGQWNSMNEAQSVFMATATFDQPVMEGWFTPRKMVSDFPQLAKVENLGNMAGLYGRSELTRFVTCPKAWACHILNENLLRAFGMTDKLDIVVPNSRFEMDQLIGQIVSANEPAIFYYWRPNAILDQFDFAAIEMGSFNGDAFPCLAQMGCASPQKSQFIVEDIGLVAASSVRVDYPELLGYLRRATMPMKVMNELLAVQERQNLNVEQVAQYFVSTHTDIWQNWVGDGQEN